MTDYLYAVIRDLGSQLRKERARADALEAAANYTDVSNHTSGGGNMRERSTQGQQLMPDSPCRWCESSNSSCIGVRVHNTNAIKCCPDCDHREATK